MKQLKSEVNEDSVDCTVEDAELEKIKSAFDKLVRIFEAVKMNLITKDKN